MGMRGAALAILLLATTTAAAAAPVRVTLDGKPVDGAEVCYFKSFGQVTCRAATEGVPPGDWKVFARKGAQLISDRVVSAGDVAVVAAAKLTDAPFIYVPRTRSVLPVQNGLVPADTDVVPLSVTAGTISGFGPVANVRAGKTAKAEFLAPREGHANVVAVILAREKSDTRVAPPDVIVQTGEKREKPLDALRATDTAPTLLFFRDVPQSGSKLVLSGKRWKTVEVAIAAKDKYLMLDPLTATQTSKLEVSWWAPVDPAKLATKQSECKATDKDMPMFFDKRSTEPNFVAILQACPTSQACKEYARRELPQDALRGSFAFEDVPAGNYEIEFHYPNLPPYWQKFDVTSEETTVLDIPLQYIAFYGKVTRGARPVHAFVYGAVTNPDTGEYNAVVTVLSPKANTVEVVACDGGWVYDFVPDDPPKENAAFDIDVPENRIVVEAHDRDTGAPIAHASVTFSSPRRFAKIEQTDDEGKLTISPVLKNLMLHVCGNHPDYSESCAPDFKMEDTTDKTVRLDLAKVHIHQGRVEGGAGTMAQIVWFSPQTSMLTELIRGFKEDGSFTYKNDHAAGEIVVLTAADRPLYAFVQPPLDADAVFEIARPSAPVRTFTVTLADTAKEYAWPALMIGNVIVPQNAVMWHLSPRLHSVRPLFPGNSVVISDVLETGPIKVLLVPQSAFARYVQGVQLPLVPDFAAFPRQDLGNADTVIFH